MAQASRYLGLDALRGAAAIMVVIVHLSSRETSWAPSAYLAVDLFFGLSGFVLAHSYGDKLRGESRVWRDFIRQRFIRLWPLYALGMSLGLATYAYQALRGVIADNVPSTVAAIVTNSLFIPAQVPLKSALNYAFPFNPPSWSLFCEMAVNIAFAYLLKLTHWKLFIHYIIGFGGVAVILLTMKYQGLVVGSSFETTYLGPIRAAFSFFVGVVIYDRKAVLIRPDWRLPPLASVGLLVLICLAPGQGWTRVAIDLAVVMAVFPVLIAQSSAATVRSPSVARGCHALGVASYPLYLIHWPLLRLSELVFVKLKGSSIHDHPKAMVLLVVLVWVAALLLGYGDEALRKRLRRTKAVEKLSVQAASS